MKTDGVKLTRATLKRADHDTTDTAKNSHLFADAKSANGMYLFDKQVEWIGQTVLADSQQPVGGGDEKGETVLTGSQQLAGGGDDAAVFALAIQRKPSGEDEAVLRFVIMLSLCLATVVRLRAV
jgi:hypothetical protein